MIFNFKNEFLKPLQVNYYSEVIGRKAFVVDERFIKSALDCDSIKENKMKFLSQKEQFITYIGEP